MNSVTEAKPSEYHSDRTSDVNGIDFSQLSHLFWRRRWLMGGILSLVTAGSGVMAYTAKPSYQASMQLLVSSSLYQPAHSQEKATPDFTDSNLQVDYTAQSQIMTSTKLLERAVDVLKSDYPDLKIEDLRGPKEKSPIVVQQLQSGTGSNKVPSQVFSISFTGNSAVKVQRVLEALKQVYLDYNLEEQQQRLSKGLTFINEQLPSAKEQVLKSEQALEQFRRTNNLLDPETQGKKLLDDLSEVQQARRKIQTESNDLQAQVINHQKKLAQSPQDALIAARLSQSSRYQVLLNEVQKTELALVDQRLLYKDNSPEIQIIVERRQEQLGLLQQEIQRVLQGESIALVNPESSQSEASLMKTGQLSPIDLKLVEQLVMNQASLVGMMARDRGLADQEQKLQQLLKQYPQLLSQYNRLKPDVEMNRKNLTQLQEAQQSLGLKIAQGGFDWQLLKDPELGRSSGSSTLTRIVIGMLVGAILGIVAALIAEQLDQVIYSTPVLRKQTKLPLLGNIPQLLASSNRNAFQNRLSLLYQPSSRTAMDRVCRNLNLSQAHLGGKSLVLTSVLSGDEKSMLILGLALSAARFNHRVLVIDADMHCPRLHVMLDLTNDRGLFNLLTNVSSSLPEKLVQNWQPMVDVLTAGEPTGDITRFLRMNPLQEVLRSLEHRYDLILINTPPSLELIDASFVAEFCQGLILLVPMGRTKRPELTQTLEMLELSNIRGIVTAS
jgi:polysaccharide biosynthesis transport protein